MKKETIAKLAGMLVLGEANPSKLAAHIDDLIQWRNVSWLPARVARWLERHDDGLTLEVAILLLDLRDELVASGAMVLADK